MNVGERTGSISSMRVGFLSAVFTVVFAASHFITGILTPARSGPFAKPADIIPYPYTNVAQFFPGDYYWLIPGLLLAPVFVVLLASIHSYATDEKKIFGQIGLSFALIYASIMMTNYFIQWTVVAPSISNGETAGLSLFTQYNPHGIFIILEALGYMMMSTAMVFAAPIFNGKRLARAVRWLFIASFVLAVGFFVGLPILGYDIVAFEVSILTINWIVLIGSGTLLSIFFRRSARS